MEIDKKYALLDTDFLYKTHLARHEISPDPNPWLEEKIKAGRINCILIEIL